MQIGPYLQIIRNSVVLDLLSLFEIYIRFRVKLTDILFFFHKTRRIMIGIFESI